MLVWLGGERGCGHNYSAGRRSTMPAPTSRALLHLGAASTPCGGSLTLVPHAAAGGAGAPHGCADAAAGGPCAGGGRGAGRGGGPVAAGQWERSRKAGWHSAAPACRTEPAPGPACARKPCSVRRVSCCLVSPGEPVDIELPPRCFHPPPVQGQAAAAQRGGPLSVQGKRHVRALTPGEVAASARFQRRHSPGCTELIYMYDGDHNGVCRFLGTHYGEQEWVNPVLTGALQVRAAGVVCVCVGWVGGGPGGQGQHLCGRGVTAALLVTDAGLEIVEQVKCSEFSAAPPAHLLGGCC